MKYKKIDKIEQVTEFEPLNGSYSFTRGNKKFLFMNNRFLKKNEIPVDISLRRGYLYVWYSYFGKLELYLGNRLLNSIEKNIYLLNKQTLYVGYSLLDLNTSQSYRNLLDPFTGELLLKANIPYMLYAEGDTIIAYNNFRGEFKRINTDTESLWEFPLSSLGDAEYASGENDRIDKILGIAHGNLWIYTYFDRLIALDIDTGYLLTVFSTHENDKWRGHDLNGGLGRVYFHQDKNIYGIGYDSLSIIDTKKLCIMEYYNTKEADPTGIGRYYSVFKPLLQGDYFTFIGEKEREYSGCGWAGIFDYKARKLVWECEIISQEERRTTGNHLIAPQQLYMIGDKLYIKDFLKNLHIFEREE